MAFLTEEEMVSRLNSPENSVKIERDREREREKARPEPESPDSEHRSSGLDIEGEGVGDINNHLLPLPSVLHNPKNLGRKNGHTNLDDSTRALIGLTTKLATTKETAKIFGISPAHAQNLKHAKLTGNGGIKKELRDKIDLGALKLRKRSIDKTFAVLSLLDTHDLSQQKPKDLVYIAREMASIAAKMTPRDKISDEDKGPRTAIQINITPQKELSDYSIKDAPIPVEVRES